MAYNKRTWKGRQGTGLNKFSINGATPVTIINQPDSIIEQGDALSAGNMNDLEDRIYTAFEDEATAREDADTALKAAIDKNTAEIDNLKQTTGQQEITVSYPDDGNYSSLMPNKVPLSVADYAEVPTFRGKSRAWNQLVNTLTTGTSVVGGVTVNVESTSFTINSGTSSYSESLPLIVGVPVVKGHKILLFGCFAQLYVNGNWYENYGDTDASTWDSGGVYTAGETGEIRIQCYIRSGSTYTTKKYVPKLYDLTIIFGSGNEPSTVADALALIPSLGQYNAFDAGSLVDTEYSGARSVGVNIWDEVTETGYYNNSGVPVANSNYLRSKNAVVVLPSTSYCFSIQDISSFSSHMASLFFYDASDNFISQISLYKENGKAQTVTSPSNARYLRFYMSDYYGTTYNHDIQICLNSLPDAIKTTYHPYKTDTLSLSETVTLRSAGSVSDELDVESGVVKRPIGTYTFTGNESWADAGSFYYSTLIRDNVKSPSANWVKANILCAILDTVTAESIITSGVKGIAISDGGLVVIDSLDSISSLTGKTLYYELATPTTESIDPVPYNFLEVEGGGTIETIQTQTPIIDNCLDVTYDIIQQ